MVHESAKVDKHKLELMVEEDNEHHSDTENAHPKPANTDNAETHQHEHTTTHMNTHIHIYTPVRDFGEFWGKNQICLL